MEATLHIASSPMRLSLSCVYLVVNTAKQGVDLQELTRRAARYLPFVPQHKTQWSDPQATTLITCWSVLPQAARGDWWHATRHQDVDSFVAYDGWFAEPHGWPLERSIAHNLSEHWGAHSFEQALLEFEGEYNLLQATHDARGTRVRVGGDRAGSRHIYYAQHEGVRVISNRALLASCVVEQGARPAPSARFLSWLMSSTAAPFRNQTAWPHVHVAGPYDTVELRDDALTHPARPHNDEGARAPMAWHAQQLRARVAQIQRWPDVKKIVALTGGQDSRAVFAALLADAGSVSHIDHAYIRADAGHPDAKVAALLASNHGVPFERLDPTTDHQDPLMQRIARHNVLTECGLHAWDLKGASTRAVQIALHGNLGELYKSHARPQNFRRPGRVRQFYTSPSYVDPHDVMTPQTRAHIQQQMGQWIDDLRAQGTRMVHMHDRIHRDARMHRWIGQATLFDGVGSMSINPLTSRKLLNKYMASSYLDQKRHTIHYELIKHTTPALLTEPFAQSRWSRLMVPWQRRYSAPVRGKSLSLSRQWHDWKTSEAQIVECLLEAPSPAFDEVFCPQKVRRVVTQAQRAPDTMVLKRVYGLLGIKSALIHPLEPMPFTMEPH